MSDNSITANKTMGVLTNHGTDSSNWNGNMIKNPINHAALWTEKCKNRGLTFKMEFVLC